MIIDDPQADSAPPTEEDLEKAKKWFEHTFADRLDNASLINYPLIYIQSRLHEADEPGVIVDEPDGAPYCQYCGALTQRACDCGPIAENN